MFFPSGQKYTSLKQEQAEGQIEDIRVQTDDIKQWYKQPRASKALAVSLVTNIAMLMTIVYITLLLMQASAKRGRLVKSPVPEFNHVVRTFKLDPLYLSLPSNESNLAWKSLPGPNGRGFINLDENDASFKFPDKKAGLSVFHQLHCLVRYPQGLENGLRSLTYKFYEQGTLRELVWDLVRGRKDRDALLRSWPEDATTPTYQDAIHGMWHYAHCLDYLRQGIQCSADLSLEFVTEFTGHAVVDGLDYPHECAAWDEVWAYAERYG